MYAGPLLKKVMKIQMDKIYEDRNVRWIAMDLKVKQDRQRNGLCQI